ncbi:MAG: hypothetical protein FWC94_05615 [Bacteroidales bacterium]|nr:hypothetical protein [Bacteroidales bacterium]
MNPILIYPQNAAQAKFYQESAERDGIQMGSISQKVLERIDDFLFAEQCVRIHEEGKLVSEENFQKIWSFQKKIVTLP